jgi:hypothetical protein
MPYTVADLENARARLERAHDHADNSRSNNPNKGRGEIRNATREVDIILAELKARGLLEKTDKEKLSDEIDRAFPNAKSKQVVSHCGKQYQLRFLPAERSLSGKSVHRWFRWWEEVVTRSD